MKCRFRKSGGSSEAMKIYITCDLEGCAGSTHWEECAHGHPDYALAREEMSLEVAAACRGALAGGAREVLVRDAHGSTRNVLPHLLPREARLLRGSSGDLMPMITGLQNEAFDALMMVGYHSAAGEPTNPLSHTFNRLTESILLNGRPMSECMYYAYAAALHGVPLVLVSGDQGICDFAAGLIPGIHTVATKSCVGAATLSLHPREAQARIEAAAERALRGDLRACRIKLPKEFSIEVRYRDHSMALDRSFYPGARQTDAKTICFDAADYREILRFIHFVL